MRAAIGLVECFDNVMAKGQHLLVRRQRHSGISLFGKFQKTLRDPRRAMRL
jgi:hypothetical protein